MTYLMDYYRVLQVHHEAAPEVIEAAYRRLARMNHPDVADSRAAAERMKQINRAYEILSDQQLRKTYHQQWCQMVNGKGPLQEKKAGLHDPADNSYRVLDDYFQNLLQERWDQAYEKLTQNDRKRVPLPDFVRWKEAVSGVFQLGAYAIRQFRRHHDCRLAGEDYPEVREFSVYTCDLQTLTGRLNEETLSKYVALDDGEWRVCLGYQDLKPIIVRLTHMAKQSDFIDPDRALARALLQIDGETGLMSRMGMMKELEKEALRSVRYRNSFSVILFYVIPSPKIRGFAPDEYLNVCVKNVAEVMTSVLRKTDMLCRWSDAGLLALLTETTETDAAQVVSKIQTHLSRVNDPVYQLTWGVSGFIGDSLEETLRMVESNASLQQPSQSEDGKRTIVFSGSAV